MNTTLKIVKYEFQDAVRGRWIVLYTVFLALATELLIQFGGTGSRVIVSLMNVVLILVPLVSIVFGTMYIYHSRNFIELLLSQPVSRKSLFGGLYVGLAFPLAAGFLIGTGIPPLAHGALGGSEAGVYAMLLGTGVLLTFVFTAIAMVVALRTDNRVQGVGLALLIWVFLAVVYDGLVLVISYSFADYPLERAMIVLAVLNPIDLGRILLLLQVDISALMGYTGAVFERFFGSALGLAISSGALALWATTALLMAHRTFRTKDF